MTYVLTQQFFHPKLENVNQFNHKTTLEEYAMF